MCTVNKSPIVHDGVEISERIQSGDDIYFIVDDKRTGEHYKFGNDEAQVLLLIKHRQFEEAKTLAEQVFGQGGYEEFLEFLDSIQLLEEEGSHYSPTQKSLTRYVSNGSVRVPIPGITAVLNKIPFTRGHLKMYHMILLGGIGLGFFEVVTSWESYKRVVETQPAFNYIPVLAGMMLLIFIIHELGHAVRLRIAGKRVTELGLMIWYIFPGLYANTSESYKLANRYERMAVAWGGSYSQLAACGYLLFGVHLWTSWTTDIRITMGYLLWVNLLIIVGNLVPLSGLDGYWMLSSYVNVTNLRQKARELASDSIQGFLLGRTRKTESEWYNPTFKVGWIVYGIIDSVFAEVATLLFLFAYIPVIQSIGGVIALTWAVLFIGFSVFALRRVGKWGMAVWSTLR